MTKESILERVSFNLEKAKQIWDWISEEKTDTVTFETNSSFDVDKDVEQPGLLLKSGQYYKHADILMPDLKFNLDEIRGIVVPCLNGETILVYPKYGDGGCQLLSEEVTIPFEEWKELDENEALYQKSTSCIKNTDVLGRYNSEAVNYIRSIFSDAFIPGPIHLVSIWHWLSMINEIASRISGADILNKDSNAWSSVRGNAGNSWSFNGYNGYVYNGYLYNSYVAVPCLPFNAN